MENKKEMTKTDRKTAVIVGVLILVAYSVIGSGNPEARVLGMLLEAISGFSVIAIAVLMFQIYYPYNAKLSLWYLAFRILEGGLLVFTGILFLSQNTLVQKIYDGIHAGHGYIFAVAALIFNYLLYQTKLIPRWLSVFGIIATVLLLIVNALEATGMVSELMVLKFPIFLNEIVLAIWLILKGFSQTALEDFQGHQV